MSYYGAKGDFYSGRTGYYRGDPGFFSFLGGVAKGLVKSYTGVDLGGGGGGAPSPPPQPTITASGSAGLGLMAPGATGAGRVQRMRGRLSGAAATLRRMGPLVTRGQAPMPTPTPMGGRGLGGRRRHRMNVCNPRALRRAIRRAKGFEKIALKSIRLVSPHRLHGKRFGGFKRTRRRK